MRSEGREQAGKLMDSLSEARSLDQKDRMLQRKMDLFSVDALASGQTDDPRLEADNMNQAEQHNKTTARFFFF